MGTRHIIEVSIGGKTVVRQYGQWDGYITGQWADIAKFIHQRMDKEKFTQALHGIRFMTKEECVALDRQLANMSEGDFGRWKDEHPWIDRNAGATVLDHIQSGDATVLHRSEDVFGIEYLYRIDMDAETVSVNKHGPFPFA